MGKLSIIFILSCFSFSICAQEICNDAIDNDGDGFIDLNDEDCKCEDLLPQSLIPNPSFEQMTCCPSGGSELNCANSWIQASLATTDYWHTCGVTSPFWLGYQTPLPFPDGQGAIGFRDGKPGFPNFKEYTGSRLLQKIEQGVEYRLDLFVGFHSDPSSEQFELAIFASPNLNSIPFGQNNENFGCPTNGTGFDQIGSLIVSGKDNWVNVVFEFTAQKDYNVIVIGPGCNVNPNFNSNPYFYFDRITIARLSEFEIPFTEVTGGLCEDDIILNIESEILSQYQWYKDGIALIGDTFPTLSLTPFDDYGDYNVLITNATGCFLSESFDLLDGDVLTQETIHICDGESIIINNQQVFDEGSYVEFIPISNICDSIFEIELIVHPNLAFDVFDTICERDIYTYESLNVMDEGVYQYFDTTEFGCESVATIYLTVEDNVDSLELGSDISINLGETIELEPFSLSSDAQVYEWRDNIIGELSNEINSGLLQPAHEQYYYFTAATMFGCSLLDSLFVRVSDEVDVYIPNVFTPATNDKNNIFSIGFTEAVKQFNKYLIYDRWGSLVYSSSGDINTFVPWDGYHPDGGIYEQGVYTYIIELELINSTQRLFAGDILLLK